MRKFLDFVSSSGLRHLELLLIVAPALPALGCILTGRFSVSFLNIDVPLGRPSGVFLLTGIVVVASGIFARRLWAYFLLIVYGALVTLTFPFVGFSGLVLGAVYVSIGTIRIALTELEKRLVGLWSTWNDSGQSPDGFVRRH